MKAAKAELNAAIKAVIDRNKLHREEVYVDGVHEYDYVMDDTDCDITAHTLLYSDYHEWSENVRETVALEIINTGDGIIIKDLNTNEEIDYLKIEQLHILLRLLDEGTVFQISEPAVKTSF
jgi:hypothetical protein